MSDATRWFVEGGIVYRLDSGEVPGRGYITESDHLAALERVRVETLRDVRRAIASGPASERLGLMGQGGSWRVGHNDALAAIDRLIDATTTPLTRCETCGHPREHHMDPPLGCYCRCTASDNATTTGEHR